MRMPDSVLEHRVDIARRQAVGGSYGARFDAVVPDVPALVVDKAELVVDQRADGETYGTQILASTRVLLHPEQWAPPGSRVTVWKGTPVERELYVIATAYLEHSKAPSQAQLWLV